jgi:hypothetical protein
MDSNVIKIKGRAINLFKEGLIPSIDKDTFESFIERRRGRVQEWTSIQWLKWQRTVIKDELNELALSRKKVEKPELILLSNRNLNK